jgi:hypothetical protein
MEVKAPTGMQLLDWIKSYDKPIKYQDWSDGSNYGCLFGRISMACSLNGIYYSLPDDVSLPQMVQILKKYLADHPKDLNRDANILIIRSLVEAYPISKEEAMKAASQIKASAGIP